MSMQQFSEEPASAYAAAPSLTETPPGSEVVSAPPPASSNAPRYDAETVQKIIALAEKMQTQHRETLTAGDIENLGRDVGVEPEFVRRALAHIEQAQMQPVPIENGTRRTSRRREVSRRPLTRLTRRQKIASLVPSALFTLLVPFTLHTIDSSDTSAIFFYLFLPAVLAFCFALRGKSKRVGALGGGLLGLVVLLAILLNTVFRRASMPSLGEVMPVLALLTSAGVSLGLGGAAIGKWINSPHQKRRRVRFVVEEIGETEGEGDASEQVGEWV